MLDRIKAKAKLLHPEARKIVNDYKKMHKLKSTSEVIVAIQENYAKATHDAFNFAMQVKALKKEVELLNGVLIKHGLKKPKEQNEEKH